MTKHNIDDLFKQKLDGHESQPSPAAWSKLEGQLNKSRKKGVIFWMGMAASLLLLITFGWLMLSDDTLIEQPTLAVSDPTIPEVIVDTVKSENIDSNQQVELVNKDVEPKKSQSIKTSLKPTPEVKQKTSVKKKRNTPTSVFRETDNLAQNSIEEMPEEESTTELSTPDIAEVNLDNTESVASNTTSTDRGSIKLVYTLKPAVAVQDIVTEEEADKAKSNPFKKAFAFAKEIKENPKGIGNLREAKNDFLSLSKKKNGSK